MRMPGGCWISAEAIVAAVVLAAAPLAAAQEPVSVTVSMAPRADTFAVSFAAPVPATTTACDDPRELLVTFDAPVRAELPPTLLDTAAGWIANVQTGYDTLLVRAARDVRFDVASHDRGVEIVLVPVGPADPESETTGQRRLELLRAQWLTEAGRTQDAWRALSTLAAQAPDDAQVLASLGLTERRIGWRRRSEDTLQRAAAHDRANPDLRTVLATMAHERAPRLRVEFEQKDVAREYRTWSRRSEGARAIGDALQVGARLESLEIDARRVRHANGDIAPLRRTIERGEAWLRIDTIGGSAVTTSLFASPAGVGGGVELERPQASGQWTIQGDVRRPFWEFAEAFTGDGTRDRLAVTRRQHLWRHVDAWITAAASRQALTNGSATTTAGVTGGVIAVLREARPFVAASYGLDKEARRRGSLRVDGAGVAFDPVPIVSREIHVPAIQVRHDIGRVLAIDAYAGYAVDRLGGRGMATEVHARVTTGRLSAEAWVDRRLQTLATTTTVTRVGVSVALRLGGRR